MSKVITIPYAPREWAKPFHANFRRMGVLLLHRRAGKSTAVINHHLRAALDDGWETQRLTYLRPTLSNSDLKELLHPPGGRHYGHVMPTRVQAKGTMWDKVKYYVRDVPGVRTNEQELLVRLPNGNKIQLFGADDPDSLRGFMFSGLSFDEYSQQPANIYSEVLSKALADHLGYALFVGTVKGEDHLYKTYVAATDPNKPENHTKWYSLWQDIDKSLASESGITIQNLEQAMADDRSLVEDGLMTQDEFDQEWYLSVDAAIKGAYFGKEMAAALKAGRITKVPFDPMLPVDTDWDLGMDDYTAIIFSQSTRSGEIRIIDYEEASGEGMSYYVRLLRTMGSEKGYIYGKHFPPHDIKVRDLSTGKSRMEMAGALGLKFEYPEPKLAFADGIDFARLTLARCYIDNSTKMMKRFLSAMRQYKKKYDKQNDRFMDQAVHNWASHAADAFRYLAVRYQTQREVVKRKRRKANGPFGWT